MLGSGLMVLGGVYGLKICHDLVRGNRERFKEEFKEKFLNTLRNLPIIGPQVQAEINKKTLPLLKSMQDDINKKKDIRYFTLPQKGLEDHEILSMIHAPKVLRDPHNFYKISGAVYCPQTQDNKAFSGKIAEITSFSNPLHPDLFPNIMNIQRSLSAMMLNLFKHPTPEEGGTAFTSGGTQSIMEVMKAYVRLAQRKRGLFKWALSKVFHWEPEIIIANTAHAAFRKAARDFGFKLVEIEVDSSTWELNLSKVKAAITQNTIAIVASGPSYPTGTIDPIRALGALALKHKLWLQLDLCLGGGVVIFDSVRKKLPSSHWCGFDVPGVTSITVDFHKEFKSEKGASMALFKDRAFLDAMGYTYTKWDGGLYATPTMQGSRPGGPIANAWAKMLQNGYEQYDYEAGQIVKHKEALVEAIKKIPGIKVMGRADVNVVAITSDSNEISHFHVADYLTSQGWHLNELPKGFHFCLTATHVLANQFAKKELGLDLSKFEECSPFANMTGGIFLEDFVRTLKKGVEYARKKTIKGDKFTGRGKVYSASAEIPNILDTLQKEMAEIYMRMENSPFDQVSTMYKNWKVQSSQKITSLPCDKTKSKRKNP